MIRLILAKSASHPSSPILLPMARRAHYAQSWLCPPSRRVGRGQWTSCVLCTPSLTVAVSSVGFLAGSTAFPQKKQDITGKPVVNQNGGSCESTPHVVFTVRYWHEPVDSHRKCASESRAVFQVAPRWISPWRPWRRGCFFKAVLRFKAACRPPNSSRIQTAP